MFQWIRSKCKLKPKLRHFKRKEFECPCCGKLPEERLMQFADKVRADYGHPMKINSGMRCDAHNKRVGGSINSQHKLGLAMDVSCKGRQMQNWLVKCAVKHGVKGIGRYHTFVHLDLRDGPDARW